MARDSTKGQTVERQARARRVVQHRIDGLTYDQISEIEGISRSTAHGYVRRHLEATREQAAEDAQELREIEAARLDELTARLLAAVRDGELSHAQSLLRVMERRARLYGLDAPTRQEVDGTVRTAPDLSGLTTDEIRALIQQATPEE